MVKRVIIPLLRRRSAIAGAIIALSIAAAFPARAVPATPITPVATGSYDFILEIETAETPRSAAHLAEELRRAADSLLLADGISSEQAMTLGADLVELGKRGVVDDAGTVGDIRLEFTHRDTLERFAATIPGGLRSAEDRTQKLAFPDGRGLRIEDMSFFRVTLDDADGWKAGDIRIRRPDGSLLYRMANGGGVADYVRGLPSATRPAPSAGDGYALDLVQFLPMPPAGEHERQVRVGLTVGGAAIPVDALRFRFFHRSIPQAEEFVLQAPELQGDRKTTAYEFTLTRRLGEYAFFEVENTTSQPVKFEDIKLHARNADGEYVEFFERDVNSDGFNYSVTLDKSTVRLPLAGGAFERHWQAELDGRKVRISHFFDGHEIWEEAAGAGSIVKGYLRTLGMAEPGAAGDPNIVDVALYKCEAENGFCRYVLKKLSGTTDDGADARLIVQHGMPFEDPNVTVFNTRGSVLYASDKSMMHNKVVAIRHTSLGPTVLLGSANLSKNSHGRWQAMTRVSGVEEFWRGYHRYLTNLLKYAPDVRLEDIAPPGASSDLIRGTPNKDGEFSEAEACPTACEGDGVHEYGSGYDTPEIRLGPLRLRAFFAPRLSPVTDSPVLNEFEALRSWLDEDPARRAEVFVMHLSQTDEHVFEALHRLNASPQADLKVLVSLRDSPDFMHLRSNVTGLDARFAPVAFEIHSKAIAIRKWRVEADGKPRAVSMVVLNGSFNLNLNTLNKRDENLARLEWVAGEDALTPGFEQAVYRPFLDVFMRAWNDPALSRTVGYGSLARSPAPLGKQD